MKTTRFHPQAGAQLIEFAIVLPVLLFIAGLVSEGAAVVRAHQVLNNAAREGARLSILPQNRYPAGCSATTQCSCPSANGTCIDTSLKNAVINYAAANGLQGLTTADITINQNCQIPLSGGTANCAACTDPDNCVNASVVTISYPYQLWLLNNLPVFGTVSTITLKTQAVFRDLY